MISYAAHGQRAVAKVRKGKMLAPVLVGLLLVEVKE